MLILGMCVYAADKPPLSQEEQSFLLRYEAWYDQASRTRPAPEPPHPDTPIAHELLLRHLKLLLSDSTYCSDENISLEMRACLLFMRAQNRLRAQEAVNNLHYWKHSEHFLEYRPALFLLELVRLRWTVQDGQLRRAIAKLESLLPANDSDMIDCAAGKPLAHLLQLLAQQQRYDATTELTRFKNSADPHLSYAAQCAILELNQLPIPTLTKLVEEHWNVHDQEDLSKLSDIQRHISIAIAAHEGARSGEFVHWFTPAMLLDVAKNWEEGDFKLHAHALLRYLAQDQSEFTDDENVKRQARDEYTRIEKKAPISEIAEALISNTQILYPS